MAGTLTGAFSLSYSPDIRAQNCSASLDQAKAEYQRGKLYEIPAILEQCLRNGFTKQQRVEAYELLSITYLYTDEPELADQSYLNLLRADPEYAPDSSKQIDIDFLSKKFKTTPIFTLYPAKLGANISLTSAININGTDNTMTTMESYKPQWGVQIGGGADLNINAEFALGAEVWFKLNRFRYTNEFFDGDSLVLNERQFSLELPVFLRYTYRINKWYPFAYAGYSFQYLLQASVGPEYYETTGQIVNPDIGTNLVLTSIRQPFNHNALLGLGAKYRLEYQYLSLEVRYTLGLKNILNTETQFDLPPGGQSSDLRELYFRYGYVDNDFRLDNLMITFGYVRPLYKPRKIEPGKGFGIGKFFGKKQDKDEGQEE